MKNQKHILESIANANSMVDLLNQLPQSTLIQRDVYVELQDVIGAYLREIQSVINEMSIEDYSDDDTVYVEMRKLWQRKMIADRSASTGCII